MVQVMGMAEGFPGSLDDMFLNVQGVKGESQDSAHKGEIDVIGWSWGMQAQTAMGGGGSSGKSVLRELRVVKRIDSASCGLMSLLRNNSPVSKAVLTVRKAGGTGQEYFKITIEKGRVTSIDVEAREGLPLVVETITLGFKKISVQYLPQGGDGQLRGAMTFDTDIDDG